MGLQVAVDDAAAVGEAGGAQDLDDDVDRGGRVERRRARARSSSASGRRRTPSRCSRCRSTRRGRRWRRCSGARAPAALEASRRKRSTNSWSSAKWWCSTFTATWRPSSWSCGEVDVGHAARAEAREHAVAAVDDRLGLDHDGASGAVPSLRGRPARRTAAPWPGTSWSVTAIATVGFGGGREGDEPDVVDRRCRSASRRCRSCPPPGRRGSARAVPVPSLTTASIIAVSGGCGGRLHHDRLHAGAYLQDGAAFGVDDAGGQVGDHQAPAVGDGGGDLGHLQRRRPASLSWPMPMRPTST